MELSEIHSKMLVRQLEKLEKRKDELAKASVEGGEPASAEDAAREKAEDEAAAANAASVPKGVEPDFGNLEEELGLTNEVDLSAAGYAWQDKYRPRKPVTSTVSRPVTTGTSTTRRTTITIILPRRQCRVTSSMSSILILSIERKRLSLYWNQPIPTSFASSGSRLDLRTKILRSKLSTESGIGLANMAFGVHSNAAYFHSISTSRVTGIGVR